MSWYPCKRCRYEKNATLIIQSRSSRKQVKPLSILYPFQDLLLALALFTLPLQHLPQSRLGPCPSHYRYVVMKENHSPVLQLLLM